MPDATGEAGPAAERRLVSVLFADLVGFTSLAEDRDPEAVRDLLTRYFDAATQAVTSHGGTVEKFIGDAVMAVWGTPTAHEDDAERAVRAALELVDAVRTLNPNLQARAGVLTGEAAVTVGATNQGMVAGDLVNTAARLQGVAEPGTVLVGETTRRAAERSIVFEPLGEHSLKGKSSPVPAWQALRVVAARGGQGRTDGLEPPFVGRDEELRQLKDVLHTIGREAKPRLLSVTGPGGIGKSRLVWELEKYVDGVSDPIYWHRGRSPSYGEGIAFWALGEMVRRRAGLAEEADEEATRTAVDATLAEYVSDPAERERIGPALLSLLGIGEAPAGGREALFPAWRSFFERIAEKGTTVLVFEDLQWADTGLLDFIDHLLDWSRGLPIMVVTLARPELFDRRPDWGAARRHLTALALEPLTDAAVRQMLEGMVPGLPEDALAAIVGRAEGMPLYAVEMVRGLLADGLIARSDDGSGSTVVGDLSRLRVPESLRSLIASRLDGLEAEDRSLLQDAAVLGQVFSSESLAAVTGADAAELETRLRHLVRRELLDVETDPRSPERGQYRFVQSLIREVAYGTLGRRDRRARHLAAARSLEAQGDDELAGALAAHYVAAHAASEPGPEADAIAAQARLALSAAAQRAAALGAHQEAIRHLQQALAVTDDLADRAALLGRAATSAAAAATEDAASFGREAVAAYEAIGDAGRVAEATAALGRVLVDAGDLEAARGVLLAAIPSAEGLDDPVPLAAMLANLARIEMRSGNSAQALVVADRALTIAEGLDQELIVAEALENKAAAFSQIGRRRESGALHRAALELAERIGDRSLEMRIRNNYASQVGDDDPALSLAMLEQSCALARDIGDRNVYHFQLTQVAAGRMGQGRGWDEVLEELYAVMDTAPLRTDRVRMRTFIGLLEARRGERLEELRADVEELVGGHEGIEDRFTLLMVRGMYALFRGDFEGAVAAAAEAFDLGYQNPEVPAEMGLRAAMRAGRADLVRRAASMTERLVTTGHVTQVAKRYARAALRAAEGDVDAALPEFAAVNRELVALGERYSAAQLMLDAAALLPHEPAVRALAEVWRPLFEELRTRADLDLLDSLPPLPSAVTPLATAAPMQEEAASTGS